MILKAISQQPCKTQNIDMSAVREFQSGDAEMALALMRDLACFEGYIDDFQVTAADLIEHGLGSDRLFTAFVVPEDDADALLGIAVTYIVPWTYDLKPVLVLKELFVTKEARGRGVGKSLFRRAMGYGRERGASKIQWTVLQTNNRAKTFYRRLGGSEDTNWEPWHLSLTPPLDDPRVLPPETTKNSNPTNQEI